MPVYGPTKWRPFGLLPGGPSMVLVETAASLDTYNLVDQQNEVAVGLEINANHLRSKSEGMATATKTLLHKGRKPWYGTYHSPTRRANSSASPPLHGGGGPENGITQARL